MNIFRILIPLMGLLLPLSLSATEYQWLTFKMTDDSEVSVAADNLSITYGNGVLHMKSATVDQSFAVTQILSMKFTTSSAAIFDISEIRQEMADYYTLDGVKAGRFVSIEEARQELPSGIYISKSEAKSLKVIF